MERVTKYARYLTGDINLFFKVLKDDGIV